MATQRMTRRTMGLAVLLVVGMAASEVLAQPGPPPMGGPPMGGPPMGGPPMGGFPMGGPPMGGFPMGGPPMGGFPMGGPPMGGFPMGGPPMGGPPMMGGLPMGRTLLGGPPMGGMSGAPRLGRGLAGRPGPGSMPGGLFRASPGPRGILGGMGPGRPPGGAAGIGGGPGLNSTGAGRPPGIPGNRPLLGPGRAGGGLADRGAAIAGSRPELGRINPHHADWYRGGWGNSRGGTWNKGRDSAAWDEARDYAREQRGWDYATAAAWGLGGWGSSDYGSGYGGYSSGSGSDSSSGSGDSYANPYYDASSGDSDYSSPVATRDTASAAEQDGDAAGRGDQAAGPGADRTKTASASAAAAAAAEERGYQAFDRARDAFKAGDYPAALDLTDEALKDVPDDALVHEFKALALFARGEYARAAAALHAVLAVTPGMSWATLSGLYPDVETYTGQLRALEERCQQGPKAAAPRFLLAYHYLVTGHTAAAAAQLKNVLALGPGDRVARRLLASLAAPPPPPEPARTVTEGEGAAGGSPSADLVGRWRGERDGSTFELSLDDRGRFLWKAARLGKATATVSGAYALSGNRLVLTPEDQPPLRAPLTELTSDSFRLKADGVIPGDSGLGFRRVAGAAAADRDQRGGPGESR